MEAQPAQRPSAAVTVEFRDCSREEVGKAGRASTRSPGWVPRVTGRQPWQQVEERDKSEGASGGGQMGTSGGRFPDFLPQPRRGPSCGRKSEGHYLLWLPGHVSRGFAQTLISPAPSAPRVSTSLAG